MSASRIVPAELRHVGQAQCGHSLSIVEPYCQIPGCWNDYDRIANPRRHGVDPDPPRCWSCGHPFGAGCECSCCYDDHSEEPGPHE